MSMRKAITRITAFALLLGLTACGSGFHLRGEADYPFKTIFLSAPNLAMAPELKRALDSIGSAKLVEPATAADVVLEVNSVEDTKSILSLSGGGKVAEYLLSKRVLFRVHDNEGRDWLPTSEVLVRRSYTYSDTETLAKEAQEQRLTREMQTDAVQQIVRRLQNAKKPPA
jgi:LPS-assembly lipoprotein